MAALLVAVATSLGCTQIISVNAPDETAVGPPHVIEVVVQPESDMDNVRGVIAFRYPSSWEVVNVAYAGTHEGALSGTVHRSQDMVNYFENDWENHAEDERHTGDFPDSEWWAGYSHGHGWSGGHVEDATLVTITIDAHRRTAARTLTS